MRVAGIVLCGGRSSRMGRPKAWLPFGGETLLQRTVRTLSEAVHPVIVVAAPGQDVPPLPTTVRIVRDEVKDRGPLGGLAAGLAALEGLADAAYLSACDVPFLTPAFVRAVVSFLASESSLSDPGRCPGLRLWQAFSLQDTGFDPEGVTQPQPRPPAWVCEPRPSLGGLTPPARPEIAVPHVGDHFHPLAAAYRLSVLPHVRELLAANRLRVANLFDAVPVRVIEPTELAGAGPDVASLRNVNKPEEYEAALRITGD